MNADVQLPWMAQAACRSVDPELFFVEKGGDTEPAKRVCRACPAVAECLAFASPRPDVLGVWGATSERQRGVMRRGMHLPKRTPAPAEHGSTRGYRAHIEAGTPICDACRAARAIYRREHAARTQAAS